jgi:hypothetical protein
LTTTGTSGAATLVGSTLNIPQYQSVITNPITGTGTTNYVSKFTSPGSIGDSLIFDNGTNVGIGTTSAWFPASGRTVLSINGTGSSLLEFQKGGVLSGYIYSADSLLEFSGGDSAPQTFLTSNTERMRIATGGSILFNTTTDPTTGGFTNTTVLIKQRADGLFGGGLQIEENGTTAVAYFGFNGSVFNIGTSYRSTGDYRPITFSTSGLERLRIANNGNVGIGTTNPNYKLEVGGEIYSNAGNQEGFRMNGSIGLVRTNATCISLLTNNSNRLTIDAGGNVGIGTEYPIEKLDVSVTKSYGQSADVGIAIGGTDNGYVDNYATSSWRQYVSGNSNGQSLKFDGFVRGVGWTERMRITSGGNVGIGTSSPAKKLSVSNNSAQGLEFGINTVAEITAYNRAASAYIPMYFDASLYNFAVGNVGIGTTIPSYKLDVDGGNITTVARFYNSSSSSSNIYIGDNGNSQYSELILSSDSGLGSIWKAGSAYASQGGPSSLNIYNSNGVIAFHPNGIDNAMFINNSGSVGIGTTTPGTGYKLNVNGKTLVNEFQYTKAINYSSGDLNSLVIAGFYDGSGMTNAPNGGWFYVTVEKYSGDDNWVHQTATSFGAANSPNEVYTRVRVGGTWGAWKQLGDAASISGTTNYVSKFTSGTTIGNSLIYDNGTNVGIGFTGPQAKLDISGGALGTSAYDYVSSQIIRSSNSNGDYVYFGSLRTSAGSDWTTAGFRIQEQIDSTWMAYMQFNGDGNNGGVSFGTGLSSVSRQSISERLRITSSGDVGIGTTNPSTKLDVDGTGFSFVANNSSGNRSLYLGTSAGEPSIQATLSNGNSRQLSLNPNGGNVGIGITNPIGKLDIIQSNGNGLTSDYSGIHVRQSDPTVGENVAARITFNADGGTVVYGFIEQRRNASDSLALGTRNSTGSAGYVSFHTQGTEKMRISGQGNVGIGTTSPIGKLNINGGTGDGSSYDAIQTFTRTSSTGNVEAAKIVLDDLDTNWGNLVFKVKTTASSEESDSYYTDAITIKGSNAFVGIGTTNPTYKLQVMGTTYINETLYVNGVTTFDDYVKFKTDVWNISDEGNNRFYFAANGRTYFATANGYEWRNSANSAIVTFIDNGNVLINTTTDLGSNLNVNSTVRIGVTFGNEASVLFGDSGTAYWKIGRPASSGNFRISSYALNAVEIQPTTGFIGVGTTDPQRKLDIVGDHNTSTFRVYYPDINVAGQDASIDIWASEPGVSFNGSGIGANVNKSPYYGRTNSALGQAFIRFVDGNMMFNTNTSDAIYSERMKITSGGYVGIGTTNPSTLLTVRGNGNNLITAQYNSDGGAAGIGFLNSAGTELWSIGGGRFVRQDEFAISRQGTTALYIDNNRNVGIGTTNPPSKLSVLPSNGDGIALTDSSSNIRGLFFIDNTNPTYSTGIRTQNYWLDLDASGSSQNAIRMFTGTGSIGTGTERMRITSGGNVGIGTTSPDPFKLAVSGTIGVLSTLNSTLGSYYIDHPGVQSWKIGVTNNNFSTLSIGNDIGGAFANKILNLTNAGRVGIGTTDPYNRFTVNGGISGTPSWNNSTLELRADSGLTTSLAFHRDGYTVSCIYSDDGSIAFQVGGGEKIRITPYSTGFGTSSPDPSAILDLTSTTQGFLPPRMEEYQRDLISAAEGLIIFNVNTQELNVWAGGSWRKIVAI